MKRQLVSALLLLYCTLCSVTGRSVSSSDCGVYGWTVPKPPAGAKLVQVSAVIRHGDRTPWTGQFCWPQDSSVWDCYLNSAEIPLYWDGQYGKIIPRVYRKVFEFGDEELSGNCSVGQLTKIGYDQHLENGASLAKAYVDSGFVKDYITPDEVYIRSDNYPRTQQSAESIMLGMFPRKGSYYNTEIVDLNTMDTDLDDMTPNAKLCPKLQEFYDEFNNSTLWKDHQQNVTKPLLSDISRAINFTVDLEDLAHFTDCLRTHKCHGLAWPQGMTASLYDRGWAEVFWQLTHQYQYPSVEKNAQVGIGFLLRDMWKNINASVHGKPVQKFLLFSGHDTTILPLLVALQANVTAWPPYASMILLELYEMSGDHYVRMIYNDHVQSLPFCAGKTLCPYDMFSSYIMSVIPSNSSVPCDSKHSWKWY